MICLLTREEFIRQMFGTDSRCRTLDDSYVINVFQIVGDIRSFLA